MIAQELESCLHNAFVQAREARHEHISEAHLLLALLDSPAATDFLRGYGVKLEELRRELVRHVSEHTPVISAIREVDTQPTIGFQRVIQRAILQVQSSGGREVTGADVLLAIFGEKDSPAARLLEKHGVPRPSGMSRPWDSSRLEAAPAAPAESPPTGDAIARDLEVCLHMAFVEAREKRHELITVEHLLLALLDNQSAAAALRACGASLPELRKDLAQYLVKAARIPPGRDVDTQPTLGFQRVLQDTILHKQLTGRWEEVDGADVLVALFKEKDSTAVQLLAQHGIARFDLMFYQAHGVAPTAPSAEAALPDAAELQVVIYNDDYTPMEFVVGVLQKFFSMTREDATETMLEVHRQGVAVCGLYAREAAVELMQQVLEHARAHGHPLHCGVVVPK